MKIGLIGCTKIKREGIWPARELYWPSPTFRKSVLYCEHCYDGWYVLSAKYHLVRPDQAIEYYQQKLDDLPKDEQKVWGRIVSNQLHELGSEKEFYALAPTTYLRYLTGSNIVHVLEGLNMYKRQTWLIQQLTSFGITDW